MSDNVGRESGSSDIGGRVLALWEENRLRCGWFLRKDFVPKTRDDFSRCLMLLQKYGDLKTYVMARKLMKCL